MSSKKIDLESAKKDELRSLCKRHGVKGYSSLSNDGMRAALRALIETDPNYATSVVKQDAPEPVATAPASLILTAVTTAPREERNGVKRPKEGGLCAQVWQALDSMRAAGLDPSTKDVRELSLAKSWNVNNATAELSAWRKFNGISRSVLKAPAKPKGAAKAAPPATRVDGTPDPYLA